MAPTTFRVAPKFIHAVAAYLVKPYDGEDPTYGDAGDLTITNTLDWEWHPEDGEGYSNANRVLSRYLAWASTADADVELDGSRVGAVLAEVYLPEDVRIRYETAEEDFDAWEVLDDWLDEVEWVASWVHPSVKIVKSTPGFDGNMKRILKMCERDA